MPHLFTRFEPCHNFHEMLHIRADKNITYWALRDRMRDQPPLQPSSFCDGTFSVLSKATISTEKTQIKPV